ncbi:hypothetical protein [Pararhizobium sp. A13]|uniref:hypothetical protein n=1 Tax=Pararhizobium sp. A13 TaxID=3133975 RepID=UPI0032523F67
MPCPADLHLCLQCRAADFAHDIGYAFGRDRTTVSHACNVVEDRRDDPAFDDFVASVERVLTSVFGAPGGREHE